MAAVPAAPAGPRSFVIGSDPSCDLVVDRPTVSARHCRLSWRDGGWWLEDLQSANGTWGDGESIVEPTRVERGDRITLGAQVHLPWPEHIPAESGGVITIGRDPDNTVVLNYPTVSSHHARIDLSGGTGVLEDLGSTNGTAVGRPDRRIDRQTITPDDVVFFGSLRISAARLLRGRLALGEGAQTTVALSGSTLVLGRDPSSDVVLDYPMVSARHAALRRSGEHWVLRDLGSTNGTFVNGGRATGPVTVAVGDAIGLGSYTLRLTAPDRLEQQDHRRNLTISAVGISVDVPARRLLDDVSLTLYPSELVGLMGPSGGGKTTLMNVLNGYTRPSAGRVLFNGLDLADSYGQFRQHIGYVPQDDIMHRELTVRQALYYNARLRLPREMTDGEIHERISRVLEQLGLRDTEDVGIGSPEKKGISGGQRKRVNLAMELLTDPLVLFLDEPTSGLSSEDAVMVMRVLRELADEAKTILLTIHQPGLEVFRLMDNLVLLAKDPDTPTPGKLAYFGPAHPDAAHFLSPDEGPDPDPSPESILRGLKTVSAEDAAKRYAASEYQRLYVDERRRPAAPDERMGAGTGGRRGGVSQWWTLARRGLRLKLRDTWNSAILLAQAPIIALLIVLVFERELGPEATIESWGPGATVLFLLAIAALWFGCSNSAREIVGEWAIYHRERMVNLKLLSYLGSKLTILGGLCVIQCLLLLGIVHYACDLRGPWLAMFGFLVLTSWVGVALGLLLSALARTSEVAIALVPLILLPLVILGGMMHPPHKMSQPAKGLSQVMASRWAFEGLLILESEERPAPASPAGSEAAVPDMAEGFFPEGERSELQLVLGVLASMPAILIVAILVVLRSRDVHLKHAKRKQES